MCQDKILIYNKIFNMSTFQEQARQWQVNQAAVEAQWQQGEAARIASEQARLRSIPPPRGS